MASSALLPCAASVATARPLTTAQTESSCCPQRHARLRATGLSHSHGLHQHPASLAVSSMFSGCLDRRSLIQPHSSPSPSPSHHDVGDAAAFGHCQRGGCGAASMSFSGANSPYEANNAFENDEYIEAHVIEAVRMVPARDHLYMTMADGSEVEVEHVNPSAGRLLYLSSMPTIFLRMADSTNLLLPIVVGDLAIGFLMKAFKKDGVARPNYYELMKELAQSLHSEVKHVKITQRVGDTYYARIYLAKPGTNGLVSVDARPSDAINLAVRAQVPIFVSKAIVHNDAVRVVYDPAKHGPAQPRKFAMEVQMDRGISGHDDMLEEIGLIKSMQEAAKEERYSDAARLRDQLTALRQKNTSKTKLNKF